ncbi:hypothetical protein [Streptomyces alboflavus]|uniref:hypothetical protein n=1 Tax=Streptomyces alboflavus TaxID=67267 RepID=UPI00146FE8A6|nr:hypothetical protein [Streptomyces alboflavus]
MSTKRPSHSLGPALRSASGGASEVARGVGGAGVAVLVDVATAAEADSLASSVFAVFAVFAVFGVFGVSDAVMVRLSQGVEGAPSRA